MAERAQYNGELLWRVGMRNKVTGEESYIIVPAAKNDEATHKLSGLFGAYGLYEWTGTGPVYTDDERYR